MTTKCYILSYPHYRHVMYYILSYPHHRHIMYYILDYMLSNSVTTGIYLWQIMCFHTDPLNFLRWYIAHVRLGQLDP